MSSAQILPLVSTPPDVGSLSPVTEGIRWLRAPLPFALDHVNIWLLQDDIVDTGINMPAMQEIWQSSSLQSAHVGGQLFLTHAHPDHIGLAGWLHARRRFEAIYITEKESALARNLCDPDVLAEWLPRHAEAYRLMGLDEEQISQIVGRVDNYRKAVSPLPPAEAFVQVAEGDRVTLGGHEWRVIEGGGHCPQHASLYCTEQNVLIAGDMVLPFITPNISLSPRDTAEADPLAIYIESLRALRRHVPETALVLPSHGVPFHGLHARIDDLIAHHDDRCAFVEDILRPAGEAGLSPAEITPLLFRGRRFNAHELFFALGETMSHLRYLEKQGRIALDPAGPVHRYKLIPR